MVEVSVLALALAPYPVVISLRKEKTKRECRLGWSGLQDQGVRG